MLLLLTVINIVKWCLLNIYITVMICSFPGVRSKKGDIVTHGDLLDLTLHRKVFIYGNVADITHAVKRVID